MEPVQVATCTGPNFLHDAIVQVNFPLKSSKLLATLHFEFASGADKTSLHPPLHHLALQLVTGHTLLSTIHNHVMRFWRGGGGGGGGGGGSGSWYGQLEVPLCSSSITSYWFSYSSHRNLYFTVIVYIGVTPPLTLLLYYYFSNNSVLCGAFI